MTRPLGNRLLVERIKQEYKGSIILPQGNDDVMDGPKFWRVIAVGPGRLNAKGIRFQIEAAAGDRILTYSHTDGPEPLGDGRHVIDADQIIAVLPT